MTYKNTNTGQIKRLRDSAFIPLDPLNTDYQEYLVWVSSGGVPEQADPIPLPILTCSPWQMRKALRRKGLLNTVKQIVNQSSDEDLKDGWEYATGFSENDPLVISMATQLNIVNLHNFFEYALTL